MKKQTKDPMERIYARRRKNLEVLIAQHGGKLELARLLGYESGSFISQVLANPPGRHISEVVARRWEVTLGLKVGWMDS